MNYFNTQTTLSALVLLMFCSAINIGTAQNMDFSRFILNVTSDGKSQALRDAEAANFNVSEYLESTNGIARINGRKSNNQVIEYYQYHASEADVNAKCNYFCKVIKSEEKKSFFGVAISGRTDFEGVAVKTVIANTAAEEAGLNIGDIITEINAEEVRSVCDFTSMLAMYEPNEVVSINYIRNGEMEQVDAKLGSRTVRQVSWESCCEKPQTNAAEPIVNNQVQNLNIQDLKLFPNPNEGLFNASFKSLSTTPLQISIVDAVGKTIYTDNVDKFDGVFNEQIDITTSPAGIYFLTILQDGKQFTKQLIIQK